MKRAMVTLLCVLSALVSVAFGFYQKSKDEAYLDNLEMNTNATRFYVHDASVDLDSELDKFQQLSQKYDASIIRSATMIEHDQPISYKAGVYTDQFLQDWPLNLTRGSKKIHGNKFITSYSTKSANQIGQIRDLFQDHPTKLLTMSRFYQRDNLSVIGTYTLICSPQDRSNIIKELSHFFSTSKASLLKPSVKKGYGKGAIYLMAIIIAAIILIIFCLMSVFYPIARLKEIGVMKLQGYSTIDIWLSLNSGLLPLSFIFYLLTIAVQIFLIKDSDWVYFAKLSSLQIVVLLVCGLISLAMVLTIRKFKLANILKDFYNFKLPLYFSHALKFLVFVGLVFTIPMMTQEVQKLNQTLSLKAAYQAEKQFVTLASYQYTGAEMDDFINGNDSVEPKLLAFYKKIEAPTKARYVATSLHDLTFDGQVHKKIAVMLGNQNQADYLQLAPHARLAKIYRDTTKINFLVPRTFQKDETQLKEFLSDYGSEYLDEAGFKKPYTNKIKINYYQANNRSTFSENADLAAKGEIFIKNPIMLCLSPHFLTETTSLLGNSPLYNPLRILNTAKNRQIIASAIQDSHLEENQLQFRNVLSSGFASDLEISQTSLIAWSIILSLAILVSILASYYVVLIILASRKKEMLVSRILGHSQFDRYRFEIYFLISIYLFGFIELLLLSRTVLSLTVYFTLVLADFVIIYALVRHHEKSSLGLALKGEEG